MKSLITMAFIVLSTSAFATLPSFSNSDFDAIAKKVDQVAKSSAVAFSESRAEELQSLTKKGSKGLTAKYVGKTDTGCSFDVEVGLFFKAKVSPKANCL